MSVFSNVSSFFGLDIGTTAVRLVEVRSSGNVKSLLRYAYLPIDSKLALSEAKADQEKLAGFVKQLVSKAGVSTRNVAVGLPSLRVFTTVVDIERLSSDELTKSIQIQADSLIPTPLSESKLDWQVIGDSPIDKTKVELLLTSVPNNYVEARLDMLEAIGLNVIAFEPNSMAMTRALIAPDAILPQLILDIGSTGTNLVIVTNGAPRLSRNIPTGYEAILRAAVQNLNIDDEQARQFVAKFGLSQSKLDGQIFKAISGTIEILLVELEKSIKFFAGRYPAQKIDRIIMTGAAASLPEFPLYVANKYGINVEIGNSWRNVAIPTAQKNELQTISNQFGVAVGLAERNE